MRHVILAAAVAAALLAGCGDDDSAKTTGPATAAAKASDTIRIENFIYEPDPVSVKAGTKVTISNADSAPHTVTELGGSPSFDSDTIKGGKSATITFAKAGTFKYFCEFHPTMKGTVTVTG